MIMLVTVPLRVMGWDGVHRHSENLGGGRAEWAQCEPL